MIRSNLSTRPFYNSRAVTLWLAVATAAIVAATMFNVTRLIRYSGTNTELATHADQDEASADEMRRNAAALRGSVDPRQIELASRDARQANDLIDRRTLSWTELFNRFETTLPGDVRITAVRPELDEKGQMALQITVLGRSVDDVDQFMQRLDATNAFRDVRSNRERRNDDGQIESQLEMLYLPQATPAEPAKESR